MEAPARGTRPKNRRAITLEAATQLFYRRGYDRVSMSDIAAATNVGASAIYRHFPGKGEILSAAIRAELAPFTEALSASLLLDDTPRARLETAVRALAACAIDHRELGVLWQREARNLDEERQRELRAEMRATTGRLAALIADDRPLLDTWGVDALAWCSMGALVSLGFHSLSLPRAQFIDVMSDMVRSITTLSLPEETSPSSPTQAPSVREAPRRDAVMLEATELFATRGFAAAGMDEIGGAVGMAGPSIYSHFASKQMILVAAIRHGSELLRADAVRELGRAGSAADKLVGLIESYVEFADRDRHLVRILLSEMNQLPEDEREAARQDQRRYIDSWVELVREWVPNPTEARIRVQAVLLIVNDAVQTPHLRDRAEFAPTLVALSKSVLQIPAPQ